MLIEFQLDAQRLLSGFRNRLRATPMCIPGEFPLSLGDCSGMTLVDHLEIHDTSAFRRAPETQVTINLPGGQTTDLSVKRLELTQSATAHLVQRADLAASNAAATPACFQAPVTLVFDLAVQAASDAADLCISFRALESAVEIPPELNAGVEALVAAQLPPSCTPLDLDPLSPLIGGTPTISNAGISGDEEFMFVAIRLEVQTPAGNAGATWDNFYSGIITPHLFGNDWSVFVDKGLILPVIEYRVSLGIEKYNEGQWYDYVLFWGPTAEWSNPNDKARVTVKVNGEKEQGCVCNLFPQDIEIEFHSVIDLSVIQDDQLASTIQVDSISHDDFSLWCCAATNMLAWGIMGPYWLEDKPAEEFWGILLAGFAHLPLVFFGSLIMAADLASELPPPSLPKAKCTENQDAVITTCVQDLDLNDNPLLGHYTLKQLRGLPGGPLLLGTLSGIPTVNQAGVSATINVFERSWADGCSATAQIVSEANILLDNTSSTPELAPLTLCEVTVLDDPPAGVTIPSQYSPYMQFENFSDVYHIISFIVPESALTPEYLADPWPLHVMVKTSAGVREITIPGILEMTEDEEEKLETDLFKLKHIDCQTWANFWHDKIFLPKWWPDPAPEAKVKKKGEHLWQVVASEMLAGESIGLRDADGRGLGTAKANGGIAQLSAVVAPAASGRDIAILVNPELVQEREDGIPQPPPMSTDVARSVLPDNESQPRRGRHPSTSFRPDAARRRLQIKQTPLVRHAVLRLRHVCVHIAVGRFDGFPALICTTQVDLRAYDVRHPALPRLVFQRGTRGLRGAMSWNDGLVVWGAHGLEHLPRGSRDLRAPTEEPARAAPIKEVQAGRGYLYALSGEGVQIYDRALRKAGEIPVRDASHLDVASRTLFLAEARGIAMFGLDDPSHPAQAGFYEMSGVRGFARPILPNATDAVFVRRGESGGVMLHVGAGRQITEVAYFESDPWFLDVAHAGSLLARPHPSRRYVTIHTTGASVTSSNGSPPPRAARRAS